MNKSDLINALFSKENLIIKQTIRIINLIFSGFSEILIKSKGIEDYGIQMSPNGIANHRNTKGSRVWPWIQLTIERE
jgi:hypothetical protein